jgi:hypothetical protein
VRTARADDLTANRPGAGARATAAQLRAAAPVRSLVARLCGISTTESAFRAGAAGERMVGRSLERLGRQWQVLHAVPVGNGVADIDHVVIGPGGVFTVNTKNHGARSTVVTAHGVDVDGNRTDYLRNARFEAARAHRLLSNACGFDVPVTAVIAVIGRLGGTGPSDVAVVDAANLCAWLRRRPVVFDDTRIERVVAAAAQARTWTSRSH